MPSDPATQFDSRWDSSDSPPDVFGFIRSHRGLGGAEVVEIVRVDQRYRWKTGCPLTVEQYLDRLPALSGETSQKIELVIGEFEARKLAGESPSVQEFVDRFSDLADLLHQRVSSDEPQDEPTRELGGAQTSEGISLDHSVDVTSVSGDLCGQLFGNRYRVQRTLGEGGFGRVFLAFDEELHRQVAVKVPTKRRVKDARNAEAYLAEARLVASLDHPNVVPVFDMGRSGDGMVYVVSKYIEGCTLTDLLRGDRPSHATSADYLSAVADGLEHAHQRRIIHRDIKPGNILLEETTGQVYLADFGLAIREEEYLGSRKVAGTPDYMSPEQARGEGHRLDARSDIYSLGVVLYELLTGKRPFQGSTRNEVLHQSVSCDPKPPTSIDESIPLELERICLKAMSKRALDRYASAADIADDLRSWQKGPASDVQRHQIVPKGLRSFDNQDADFFLELMPGPRSRSGLPAAIEFWKTQIEETDPDNAFNVGLIYGPSGCGKSSMVKAGLLPRLSRDVTTIYIEATPRDTENRLLRQLRKRVPDAPRNLGLVETFGWIRRKGCLPVVVILDQFEQWLQAHRGEPGTDLVRALRQADGIRLQAIVMVRDDFSMAASRFMRELEIPLMEGRNFAAVDLFDVEHAENVLARFGQAFGKLPKNKEQLSEEQEHFLRDAASGLAVDGKVVSVRLAVFAEMIKGKPWIPSTLREVGGTEGIGANFLDEIFSGREANPEHRAHQEAARRVLMSLLPDVGSDIKGHMRSHDELHRASGYQESSGEFNDLLRILDGKLRLITPTDPEGTQSEPASDHTGQFYQLTHDYLVPSLRTWLTRKQRETRRGRAELLLAERASLWKAKPQRRFLPSAIEWAKVHLFTDAGNWSQTESRLMRAAGRMHITHAVLFALMLAGVLMVATILRQRASIASKRTRSEGLVTTLVNADLAQVPQVVDDIASLRPWVEPELSKAIGQYDDASQEKLNLSLALLPGDTGQLDYLSDRLINAEPNQIQTIRTMLSKHRHLLLPELWRVAEDSRSASEGSDRRRLLNAASSLAAYDPNNATRWSGIAESVVEQLADENSLRLAVWSELLRPARAHLLPPLIEAFRDVDQVRNRSQVARVTDILEDYASDQPNVIAELIFDSEPQQFSVLIDEFASDPVNVRSAVSRELKRDLRGAWPDASTKSVPDPLSDKVLNELADAGGMIDAGFAFCQSLPMSRLKETTGILKSSGYRLSRLRPYQDDVTRVAAVWLRDDSGIYWCSDKSRDEIQDIDHQQQASGRVPIDVAGYVAEVDGNDTDRFSGIWIDSDDSLESGKLFAGVSHQNFKPLLPTLEKSGYAFVHTLQAFRGTDGQRMFCSVIHRGNNPSTVIFNRDVASLTRPGFLHKMLWDLDPSRDRTALDPQSRRLRALRNAEQEQERNPNVPSHWITLAELQYGLGLNTVARGSLNQVIADLETKLRAEEADEKQLNRLLSAALCLRAKVNARLGNAEESRQDYERLEAVGASDLERHAVKLVCDAYGDREISVDAFEDALQRSTRDPQAVLLVVAAYVEIATAVRATNDALSAVYASRATRLLEEGIDTGLLSVGSLKTDSRFDSIRETNAFSRLTASDGRTIRYATVWNHSSWLESEKLFGLSPQAHLEACRRLSTNGYRVASIGVVSEEGVRYASSVWHRPVVKEDDLETLARRKANAALAALRIGEGNLVWPLLRWDADRRLRSWIIHRVAKTRTRPELVLERLVAEKDDGIRHALILMLGQFNETNAIDRVEWTPRLLEIYANDANAAVRAAAQWALGRWGKNPSMKEVDRRLGAEPRDPDRNWYVMSRGHTMVKIRAGSRALIGSPYRERGRSTLENLHLVELPRDYSIASTEVTREQFQQFLLETGFSRSGISAKYSPRDDCPQVAVTWYEAAAYCRWLSEVDGMEENQMCFPPINQIGDGMELPSDYLTRTGYRLPTEAEWEHACRAETRTKRPFGDSDALLGQYAWYAGNSENHAWPVASLIPNSFGLFDMLGNVQEWCQEGYYDYGERLAGTSVDQEDTRAVDNTMRRMIRGGAFGIWPAEIRSAHRSFNRPGNRFSNSGFRVARTLSQSSSELP